MPQPSRRRRRSGFGNVRKLPSGRWQARYPGPDGRTYKAPMTFEAKGDAVAFLSAVHTDIARGVWVDPATKKATRVPVLGEYASAWLEQRDIKPRTRAHYRELLAVHIAPTFGDVPLTGITPAAVRTWHATLQTGPTARAHAYSLLRTILGTAVDDGVIVTQPCRIRGASRVERAVKIEPATIEELHSIAELMPSRLRLIVPLSAWCALRFGEVTELRRRDVDLAGGVLRIRRGVVRVDGQVIVDTPKTVAGTRHVHVPEFLLPAIKAHLRNHAQIGANGLLFHGVNGGQLAHSSFTYHFNRAAEAVGRPDLTPHALRHTGATLAARSGATIAELMARLGHTSPAMALRYQHAAAGRDAQIAAALGRLWEDQAR
jgi:integrase